MSASTGLLYAEDGHALQGIEEDAAPSAEEARSAARHSRIALAAYLLAESRGFEPGWELDDWLKAERAVDGDRSVVQA